MNIRVGSAVSIVLVILMIAAIACQGTPAASPEPSAQADGTISPGTPLAPELPSVLPEPGAATASPAPSVPANTTITAGSPLAPPINESVEALKTARIGGTLSYRERIALTSGAVVELKLVAVSSADAPATTLGYQMIENPSQVPISFEIAYNPADIDDRFTYAISAQIRDQGRVLFVNTTRYAVLTGGNPYSVDMILQMPENLEPISVPPPASTQVLPEFVGVPAPIESAEVAASEVTPGDYVLSIVSGLPSSCASFYDAEMSRDGNTFTVAVTNLVPGEGVLMACAAVFGYYQSMIELGSDFEVGESYTVTINDTVIISFVAQPLDGPKMVRKESPIESVQVTATETTPTGYTLTVVSRLPLGSSCSKFDGYNVIRRGEDIQVAVSHLEVVDTRMPCTADLPVVITEIPLGSDFESGNSYTISVNGDNTETFEAK